MDKNEEGEKLTIRRKSAFSTGYVTEMEMK
jgi:hypothetical protein